jgi:hypothetical protein
LGVQELKQRLGEEEAEAQNLFDDWTRLNAKVFGLRGWGLHFESESSGFRVT